MFKQGSTLQPRTTFIPFGVCPFSGKPLVLVGFTGETSRTTTTFRAEQVQAAHLPQAGKPLPDWVYPLVAAWSQPARFGVTGAVAA